MSIISFLSGKNYYYFDDNHQLQEKKLNFLKNLGRRLFGLFPETHLKQVVHQGYQKTISTLHDSNLTAEKTQILLGLIHKAANRLHSKDRLCYESVGSYAHKEIESEVAIRYEVKRRNSHWVIDRIAFQITQKHQKHKLIDYKKINFALERADGNGNIQLKPPRRNNCYSLYEPRALSSGVNHEKAMFSLFGKSRFLSGLKNEGKMIAAIATKVLNDSSSISIHCLADSIRSSEIKNLRTDKMRKMGWHEIKEITTEEGFQTLYQLDKQRQSPLPFSLSLDFALKNLAASQSR